MGQSTLTAYYKEGSLLTKSRISFEEWIDQTGAKRIARKLDIDIHSVWHWRAHRCDPSVKYMRILKRWSKGDLDYAQMIDRGKK